MMRGTASRAVLLLLALALLAAACSSSNIDDRTLATGASATNADSRDPGSAATEDVQDALAYAAPLIVNAWLTLLDSRTIEQYDAAVAEMDPQGTMFAGAVADSLKVAVATLTAWDNCVEYRGCAVNEEEYDVVAEMALEPGSGLIVPMDDGRWYVDGSIAANTPLMSTLIGGFVFTVNVDDDIRVITPSLNDVVMWSSVPQKTAPVPDMQDLQGPATSDTPGMSAYFLSDMVAIQPDALSSLQATNVTTSSEDVDVQPYGVWLNTLTQFSSDALILFQTKTPTSSVTLSEWLTDMQVAGDLEYPQNDVTSYRPQYTRMLWPAALSGDDFLVMREVYAVESFQDSLGGEYQFSFSTETTTRSIPGMVEFTLNLGPLHPCRQVPANTVGDVLPAGDCVVPPVA